jgi:hypothetical protein
LGPIERVIVAPIVFTARLFAFLTVLMLWIFPIGPIWFAILLRTIAMFSIATVRSLFTGQNPPDEQRLNFVSGFWLGGFVHIAHILVGRAELSELKPSGYRPIEEVGIACIFYMWMLTSLAYLKNWLEFVSFISASAWKYIMLGITTLGRFL